MSEIIDLEKLYRQEKYRWLCKAVPNARSATFDRHHPVLYRCGVQPIALQANLTK